VLKKLILSVFLTSCAQNITYLPDSNSLSPSQGNSPEILVLLNGKSCQDLDGIPGLCSLRLPKGSILNILIPEKAYSSTITLTCSKQVQATPEWHSIEADQSLILNLSIPDVETLNSFICVGEVFPVKEAEGKGSKFEFRVKTTDAKYIPVETPRVETVEGKHHLILGINALHSYVYDRGEWKYYHKEYKVAVSSPWVKAVVETQQQRRAYYGF